MNQIKEYNDVYYPQQNDSNVVKALLDDRIWEKNITKIFKLYIKENSVVVDAGAYIGLHTLTMANLAKKVYSFEPQPLVYQCLKQTLEKKQITNVDLHHVALSSKSGETTIHTNNDGDASVAGIRDAKFSMSFPVSMETLDSYNIGKVDFLKIDVEGHEWDVLEGSRKLILNNKPIIILETFKTKKNIKKLKVFALQFNYSLTYISGDNYLLRPSIPEHEN